MMRHVEVSVPAGEEQDSVDARVTPTGSLENLSQQEVDKLFEWVRRLTRAGIAAELHVIPGAYHGFGIAAASPQAMQLQEWRLAALRRAFGG